MTTIQKPHRFVRTTKGLPLTGLVVREDVSILGEPIYVVYEYGYNLREIAWRKSDCYELTEPLPSYFDIDGWLRLANRPLVQQGRFAP